MRRSGLLLLALLAAPAARAEDEEALRRETGELLGRVLERTTRPREEQAELVLTVSRQGRPFDRAARVEVSWREVAGGEELRLRFREPPALQDHAWLQVWRGEEVTCWRWTPERPRPERVTPLPDSWRLAGSGLTLDELRGERAQAHAWRLLGEERRPAPGTTDEAGPGLLLHLLEATPRAGEAGHPGAARRLLKVEAERRLPLELEWQDARGKRLKAARLGDWRALRGRLRPFALEYTEPDQVTRVRANLRRGQAPAEHFAPSVFWR